MSFIRRNMAMIIAALIMTVLGSLYVYERYKPTAVFFPIEPIAELKTNGADTPQNAVSGEAARADTDGGTDKTVKVYIAGAVHKPGVYEVTDGARVDDVLQMAGGSTDEADLLRVNLAAYVTDTQRIIIPTIGGELDYADDEDGTTDEKTSEAGADGLININTADAKTLQLLPGIGETIAGNIINYRETHGAFATIFDIKKVSRIGDATFERIKDMITV